MSLLVLIIIPSLYSLLLLLHNATHCEIVCGRPIILCLLICSCSVIYSSLTTLKVTLTLLFITCLLLSLLFENAKERLLWKLPLPIQFASTKQIAIGSTVSSQKEYSRLATTKYYIYALLTFDHKVK